MNPARIVQVVLLSSLCTAGSAQDPPAGAAPAPKAAGQDPAKKPDAKAKAFTTEQLEQIVAPIALYSDALLAQTMMAATYPIEVVQASRWVKQNATLKGDALEKALQGQKWDPSVKGLCGVPAVLNRLNENLDWTQDLGDAYLADQSALMLVVQKMRRKALEAGNLKTTKEQKVTEREDQMIVVESADPQVVYVPTYYPTVVYGSSWYYPTYYYPPMYAPCPPGYPAFTFMAGMVWGAAIWGGCSWGHNHCETNINVNNFNTFVDRTESGDRRAQAKQRADGGKLPHSADHRQGVRYRDQGTAERFGGAGATDRVARDQARGRPATQPAGGTGNRPGTQPAGGANRPGTQPAAGGNRPATQPSGGGNRPATQPAGGAKPAARPANTGQRTGSFNGSSSAGSTRAASSRGSASRGGGGGRSGGGGRR